MRRSTRTYIQTVEHQWRSNCEWMKSYSPSDWPTDRLRAAEVLKSHTFCYLLSAKTSNSPAEVVLYYSRNRLLRNCHDLSPADQWRSFLDCQGWRELLPQGLRGSASTLSSLSISLPKSVLTGGGGVLCYTDDVALSAIVNSLSKKENTMVCHFNMAADPLLSPYYDPTDRRRSNSVDIPHMPIIDLCLENQPLVALETLRTDPPHLHHAPPLTTHPPHHPPTLNSRRRS